MDYWTEDLTALFAALAARMALECDALCALDAVIADADHGIAMEQGMAVASAAIEALESPMLQDQFNAVAKAFLNAVCASSGPLSATALLRAGKVAAPRAAMPKSEGKLLVVAMTEGIVHRGKAQMGQKSMVDALAPAAEAVARSDCWAAVVAAVKVGAEATRSMVATLGHAARLGERSLWHPDPGAISATTIIAEIARPFGQI